MSRIRIAVARRGEGRQPNDKGMTLIELLIAIVLLAGITAGIASAFVLTVRASGDTADRIKKSNDAQAISAFLVRDAASAGAYGVDNKSYGAADRTISDIGGLGLAPGVSVGGPSTGFCPNTGLSAVVRFEWIERTAGATASTRVASVYGQDANTLVRVHCEQTFNTVTGTTGTPSVSSATIARNVGAVAATCNPGCTATPSLPDDVTLNVTSTILDGNTSSAYTYSVSGSLRVGQLSSGTASGPSSQILALLALGAESAPCPSPTTPRSSGLSMASANDRLTVYGAAAIDATPAAACGAARNFVGGSVIATETLTLAGTTCAGSNASCTSASGNFHTMGAPIPDPYVNLAPPTGYDQCNPSGTNPGTVAANTLAPGIYNQLLNVDAFLSTVYFRPGVYILCNGIKAGNNLTLSTVSFGAQPAGSLFYLAGGTVNITSSAQVALQGLGSGPYKDMLIWQPNPTTTNAATTGDINITTGVDLLFILTFNASYNGVIYAPYAQVQVADGVHLLGFSQLEATIDTIVARNIYFGPSSGSFGTRVRMGPGPATTTSLTVSPNPPLAGQNATFTAQVTRVAPSTAADGALSGTVSFISDGQPIGNAVTVGANGLATMSAALTGGNHTLVASYSGNGIYASSISPPIGTTVDRINSNTVLLATQNPSGLGQPATFRATVTGAGAMPTGTVTFYRNGVSIGTAAVDAFGVANFSTTSLPIGTSPILATYDGDNNYFASNSNTVNQVVRQAAAITLTNTPAASVVGGPVTLTATVTSSPSGGTTPTGTVQFYDGASALGAPVAMVNGVATLVTQTLSRATHTITAQYSGDATYGGVTSASVTQTVTLAASTTVLVQTDATQSGLTRGFTIAVTGPIGGPTPTGTVEIRRGATLLGTGTLTNGSVDITVTLQLGSNTIQANYLGDNNYATSSSAPLTVTATRDVVLTRTSPIGTTGWDGNTDFDFKADVVPTPPTVFGSRGTVRFYQTSSTGVRTQIGSGAVASNGEVNIAAINFPPGTWTISAVWTANGGNPETATSNNLTIVISGDTAVTITRSPSGTTQSYGTAQTYNATVAPFPGSTPRGTIQWYVDGVATGAVVQLGTTGTTTASFTPVLTVAGSPHTIRADYSGEPIAGYSPSSASVTQAITKFQTNVTVALTTGINPSPVGSSLTFTATVPGNGNGGTPTGSVQFFVDGVATGGAMPVTGATLTTSSLTRGTRTITATYSGDANYAGDSGSQSQDIGQDPNVTLTRQPAGATSTIGQSVTFRLRVTNPGGGYPVPTGMVVVFYDGATQIGSPQVVALTAGNYDANISTSTLPAGGHSITAVTTQSNAYNSVTSNAVSLTVNKNSSSVSLARFGAVGNTSVSNAAFTYRATVASGTPTPTGNVTFVVTLNGTQVLTQTVGLTGLTADFTVAANTLAGDDYVIGATYNGDASYSASTQATANHHINYPTPPVITAISVATGAHNTTINPFTVTGTGFQPNVSLAFIYNGTGLQNFFCGTQGVSVTILSQTTTSITGIVTISNNANTSNTCRRTLTVANTDGQTGTFGTITNGFRVT
jgi:prepilin-type N-terminal cleavage/methylation domain-containing protein